MGKKARKRALREQAWNDRQLADCTNALVQGGYAVTCDGPSLSYPHAYVVTLVRREVTRIFSGDSEPNAMLAAFAWACHTDGPFGEMYEESPDRGRYDAAELTL